MQQEEKEEEIALKYWYGYAVRVLMRHGLEPFITQDLENFLAKSPGNEPSVIAQIVNLLVSTAHSGSRTESTTKLIPGHQLLFSSGMLEIKTLALESTAA